MIKIGLILGKGMRRGDILSDGIEHFPDTPYGRPSTKISTGKRMGKEVCILQRHGAANEIPAFAVNYRANIYALHVLGCTHIVATSFCGSLQEEIETGDLVVFDQFIDLTTHREMTFTDKIKLDQLNHTAFHKPFSETIRNCLIESAVVQGITVHTKGTVLAVDGPRQSTRAESNLYRRWGADVVNTTTAPEAILSHELGMSYGAISLCNYFDSWRTDILPSTRAEKNEIAEKHLDQLMQVVLGGIERID